MERLEKKRHLIPVALVIAALLALVPATTAGAYPEPDVSPKICDVDWSKGQWHVKQPIKCAARRWKVPGGPDKALDVAGCESGFEPKASANGNAGVFQQRVTYWPGRANAYGFKGWPALNGRANIIVSIRMAHAGGWDPWPCA